MWSWSKTNIKVLIIIVIIAFITIFLTVIYPTINYKTWGNNELSYHDGLGREVICDEILWQPPSNCRIVSSLPTYDESLAIRFSPLYYEDVELSFDWCTENNGFWNADDSTCYFENEQDLGKGMIAVKQYGENAFGDLENED